MRNRIISAILALILCTACIAMIPTEAKAATVASGTSGGVNWKLSSDGVLTIYGNGETEDYTMMDGGGPWCEYLENIKSVIIEDGVTGIGNLAFCYCSNLVSVSIPDSVEWIGDTAFRECTSLKSIRLPNSITWLGEGIFYKCTGLKRVEIENGFTYIGSSMFADCSSLKEITIPDSVLQIGGSAFLGCSSLKEINIPDSVGAISKDAFADCTNLRIVIIPKSVNRLVAPFYNCSKLDHILYKGTETEWNDIKGINGTKNQISELNTTIHYGCTGNEIINDHCIICDGEIKGSTNAENSNIPWALLIIIPVVCIGGGAALALLTSKKKKSDS